MKSPWLRFAEPDEVAGTERELSAVCTESDIVPLSYTRLSAGGDYWKRLRAIFSSSPFTIDRFRSDEMRARLEQRVRDRSFDVIVCDNVFSAINLPANASPVVMNSQNVEYVILSRYVQHERNPFKALYARWEASKLRRFEAAMYRRAVLGYGLLQRGHRLNPFALSRHPDRGRTERGGRE